jgi:sulfoxide reductase catalytic subunit YedY
MARGTPSEEITPLATYCRRHAIMGTATTAGIAALLAACGGSAADLPPGPTVGPSTTWPTPAPVPEDVLTPIDTIVTYNNFYEFSTDKERVAKVSEKFTTSPWTLSVGGLVEKPRTFSTEDLVAMFKPEERVFRLRCVEGWSMVIPWQGFPLSRILEAVVPKGDAKFVRFETVKRPEEMPGQRDGGPYNWPYVEGLRLDEARNPLATVATGLYGKALPPQNGAPVRLVAPWKYGFKSVKSIVKVDLVAEMPKSLWMAAAPDEYGFYANVNPDVPHPRWSQATERRLGELKRRPTLFLNGYADQVASLYEGMDLRRNF